MPTSPSRTVVFLVADESKNAGERDYMFALADEIEKHGKCDDTRYLVYKIPHADSQTADITGDARQLPQDNEAYKKIPTISDDALKTLNGDVQLIGVGHSTLSALDHALDVFEKIDITVEPSYITHRIDDLNTLIEKEIVTFSPVETAATCDKTNAAAFAKLHRPLDAMPHTYTSERCNAEHNKYMQTENGKRIDALIENGKHFVFAVLNAGFEDKDKRHLVYAEDEAARDGYMLGQHMLSGTQLVLAHGGPRNLIDEELGHDTMHAFANGYYEAQDKKSVAPSEPILERYSEDCPYNVIKASYVLAQAFECVAYVPSVESYACLDASLRYINNRECALFMMVSDAVRSDPQRQKNTKKYFKAGISVLKPKEDGINEYLFAETDTPHQTRNAAEQITKELQLVVNLPLSGPSLSRPTP